MGESSAFTASEDSILKILISTDNHLGYEETDPIIGNDSFIAFEEVLQIAVEKQVDMILLGGDLFHDNNPSQQTFNRCMSLLRKYTMGERALHLKLRSHVGIEHATAESPANYLDVNLNISIPVFSIHGNHDDPSGVGLCSALDTLSAAGLVNYFGRKTNLEDINILPILLEKGETRLALYGLSHIKDERLSRLFLQEKVKLIRPQEFTDEWFNLFVLHQNRADRGPKRFISDSYLPDFLNLIVWGHEHDCDIVPQQNLEKGFFVTQPGSTVPTSLSEGETKPKHVALLTIKRRKFKFDPIKLQTTRPFVFRSIKLDDIPVTSEVRSKKQEEISNYCFRKVDRMIIEAKSLLTGHPQQPTLPLIRLRCEYRDDSQLFNTVKFGQKFYKKVANLDNEIIRMKKLPAFREKTEFKDAYDDLNRLRELKEEEPESFSACVESIVEEYFELFADKKMTVLSVKGMGVAVKRVIEKGDANAISTVCQHQRDVTLKKLMEFSDIDERNVLEYLHKIRDERNATALEQEEQLRKLFESRNGSSHSNLTEEPEPPVEDLSGSDDEVDLAPSKPLSGARKNTRSSPPEEISLDEEVEEPPTRGRGRGRGRGTRGRGATATRARGARASRAKPPLASPVNIASFFPPTQSRASQARGSFQLSQSAISYDDSD